MKAEELALTLKKCRQPGAKTITVEYENGCRQVIRPSLAYDGNDYSVAAGVAGNTAFKLVHED